MNALVGQDSNTEIGVANHAENNEISIEYVNAWRRAID